MVTVGWLFVRVLRVSVSGLGPFLFGFWSVVKGLGHFYPQNWSPRLCTVMTRVPKKYCLSN